MGAAVGIIPFVDWALQKFVINKNAFKKVGEIFGIDAKIIDEYNEKENSSNSYIIGNKLIEQETKYKIGKTVECITQTGEYVSMIPTVSYGISETAKSIQFSAQAAR